MHPIAAIKVKQISKKCFKIYNANKNNNQLDTFNNGGKLDAYRHTFFMAAFAQKVKIKKIKKLGIAHEKYNYHQFLKNDFENNELPDSLSTIMDLKNNDLGFELGKKYGKETIEALSELIIKAITKGDALIVKRNKNGEYINCNGDLLGFTKQKKWNLNKCLVKSNGV